MTTIEAQTLIRKADNGEQMLAFLEVIAAAAAAGTLEAPEADDEVDEDADYDEADYDEADDERLAAEIDF